MSSYRFGTGNSGSVPRTREEIMPFPYGTHKPGWLGAFMDVPFSDQDKLNEGNFNDRKRAWKDFFRKHPMRENVRSIIKDLNQQAEKNYSRDEPSKIEFLKEDTGYPHLEVLSDSERESESEDETPPPPPIEEVKETPRERSLRLIGEATDLKAIEADSKLFFPLNQDIYFKFSQLVQKKTQLRGQALLQELLSHEAEVKQKQIDSERLRADRAQMSKEDTASSLMNKHWDQQRKVAARQAYLNKRKQEEEELRKQSWYIKEKEEAAALKKAMALARWERKQIKKKLFLEKPYLLLPNQLKVDSLDLALKEKFNLSYQTRRPPSIKSHQWNRIQTYMRFVCEDVGLDYHNWHKSSRFLKGAEEFLEVVKGYMKTLRKTRIYYSKDPKRVFVAEKVDSRWDYTNSYEVKEFKPKYAFEWYLCLDSRGEEVFKDTYLRSMFPSKRRHLIEELRSSISYWSTKCVDWRKSLAYTETKTEKTFVPGYSKNHPVEVEGAILEKGNTLWHKHGVKEYQKPFLSRIVTKLNHSGIGGQKRTKVKRWVTSRNSDRSVQIGKRQNGARDVGMVNRQIAAGWLEKIDMYFEQVEEKKIEESVIFEDFNEKLKYWAFKKNSWSYQPERKGRKRLKSIRTNYQHLIL